MGVNRKALDKILERNPKLPPKLLESLIRAYNKEQVNFLLENGHVNLTDDIRVDIVPITKRRYILRGIEYESQRLYKLKVSLGEKLYREIYEEYEKFREVD